MKKAKLEDINKLHIIEPDQIKLYPAGKHGGIIGNYIIIDPDDFELLSKYVWRCFKDSSGQFRPVTSIKGKETLLYRYLLNITDSTIEVDHINQNALDNRRINLRTALRYQNAANKRKHEGVLKYKGIGKQRNGNFLAQIKHMNKIFYIGTYASQEEAAIAYDKKCLELNGEYASLNFPDLDYGNIPYPPNVDKKLSNTNIRYIYYCQSKQKYVFQIIVKQKRTNKSFKTLEEAIAYKESFFND